MTEWVAVSSLKRGVFSHPEPLSYFDCLQADLSVENEHNGEPVTLCQAYSHMLEIERKKKNLWWEYSA